MDFVLLIFSNHDTELGYLNLEKRHAFDCGSNRNDFFDEEFGEVVIDGVELQVWLSVICYMVAAPGERAEERFLTPSL